jgi:hypothetical protein
VAGDGDRCVSVDVFRQRGPELADTDAGSLCSGNLNGESLRAGTPRLRILAGVYTILKPWPGFKASKQAAAQGPVLPATEPTGSPTCRRPANLLSSSAALQIGGYSCQAIVDAQRVARLGASAHAAVGQDQGRHLPALSGTRSAAFSLQRRQQLRTRNNSASPVARLFRESH